MINLKKAQLGTNCDKSLFLMKSVLFSDVNCGKMGVVWPNNINLLLLIQSFFSI